nr:YqaE/Pmp3 family membrane protein [Chitinophagaceae bacterium]
MRKFIYLLFPILILSFTVQQAEAAYIVPQQTSKTTPDKAMMKEAFRDFRKLPRKERRAKIKEVKKEMKAFKAARKANGEPSTNTLLLVILAILLPPLAVYLHEGVINSRFWISLLLTLLFWLPGVIYALIVILG